MTNNQFMKRTISTLIFNLAFLFTAFAQNTAETVEMADIMRSNGKIYIVVAVVLAVLIGVLLYLVRLDSKISKIEKQINK